MDMNRTLPKYLITALLLLLLFTASSCEKSKESLTSGSSGNTAQDALSHTTKPSATETATAPSISPVPAIPSQITFDMSGDQTSSYAEYLYVEANETSVSIFGAGNEPVHINGSIANVNSYCNSVYSQISQVEYAMDGSSLAILLDCNIYRAGRLVYSDGITEIDIASNVDSFHLSGDGSAILYLVTPKYEHGIGGDLYYFDCVTGESLLITKGAGRLFTVSPKGDAISYTTFYKADDPDALTCYSLVIGKAPVVVDTDSYCAAITDDSRIVYYLKKTDQGEILLVNCAGASKQLTLPNGFDRHTDDTYFYFNTDQTQIVFISDGSTYFSISGSDPYKISNFSVYSFAGKSPYDGIPNYLYKTITDSARTYITTSVFGTKNLCYVPFQTENNTLLIFDENMKITEFTLPGYLYGLYVSSNSFITYDSDGSIICENYPNPDFVEVPEVTSAFATEDQTYYFLSRAESTANPDLITYIDNLYVTFGSFDMTEGELLASNVSGFRLFEREGSDILYFLAYPEDYDEEASRDNNLTCFWDLYAVQEIPGAKPVLIADKVSMIETGDFGVVYWQYKDVYKGDFEGLGGSYMATVGVYASKDGEAFQYVMDRPYIVQYGG